MCVGFLFEDCGGEGGEKLLRSRESLPRGIQRWIRICFVTLDPYNLAWQPTAASANCEQAADFVVDDEAGSKGSGVQGGGLEGFRVSMCWDWGFQSAELRVRGFGV